MNITHLTSVHPRYDTRIFLKECSSLAKIEGYRVNLVVADGKGDEEKNGVKIHDVGCLPGRLNRIFRTTKNVYKKALELDSDIYHLHDPELIPVGLKLKKRGKRVIFDVHENIAKQMIDKDYMPKAMRNIISKLYRYYEKKTLNKFDYIVLAENSYDKDYGKLSVNIEIILNMPQIEPLGKFVNFKREKAELFYIGGISKNRGIDVIIEAVKILKEKFPAILLHCIGPYDKILLENLEIKDVQDNINFYGRLQLYEGLNYSINAKAGLSILKPIKNYTESYSTKVFEYMAIGLPVITSDFEIYRKIIQKNNCGICVNPENPTEIAEAIEYIISHPKEAEEMGKNGRKAVEEKYNWSIEEKKLLKVYEDIISGSKRGSGCGSECGRESEGVKDKD
ncbi:MAG: glycosyltransferase family 4 protein [Flexistipes sinusarabici]|uniref:Glycosyltransferase family 4 protein n=1 Tax=Flexistipes sinusarabici TaxID=2352 RepID=A0A5D0MNI8_FLESI|nr:MAG: glycosyltransferase family 4 protein [Flexistipes sinusarabici]